MASFIDANGTSWTVEIDGLTLAELREKAGVDLLQDGLYAVEQREDSLLKALLILCAEQKSERKLSDKQFARLVIGDVLDRAIEAVRGAAQSFFRPSRWSEILSRCERRKSNDKTFEDIAPVLELLNRPDMPAAMREAVMSAIGDQIAVVSSSQSSPMKPSAFGQDANQPSAAGA